MSRLRPLAGDVGRRFRLPRLHEPSAWVVLLIAIPVLAAFYLLLPTTGLSRTVAYPAFSLIGMIAILIGVHRRGPDRPGSWRLIAIALALLAIGDTVYSILALDGAEVAYPSPADIAYLGAYIALIGGVVGLVRGRVPGSDRTPIIDAAILSAGAGSIYWIAVVHPSLQGASDPIVWMVSMAYPGMDIILLAIGLRVLLTAAARPRYLQILFAGIGLYFVADVIYAITILHDTYLDAQWVDGGWIVGVMLIGVAALHPSVADKVSTVLLERRRA